MLRFFRVNDPYRLLGVLLVMIAASFPFLLSSDLITVQELKDIVLGESLNSGKTMYTQLVDDTPWLASKFSQWMETVFGRSFTARHLLALVVLFFQAVFFSLILVRNKAYSENNYFPALIFGVLCFFSFDVLSLSDELWASVFLLFAISNLFTEIEFKVQRDETILNLGVYVGIASLFVFSYSIFLIGTYIILLAFARISIRKTFLLFFGFLFPHTLIIAFYYFKDGLPELFHSFYSANFTVASVALISWSSLFWLSITILVYFFFSIMMLSREARFTRYQSQLLQVMFIWMLIALLTIVVARERTPHSFVTLIPSLSYFISHYLLLIRRKWIAEMMLWLFIITIVGVGSLARWNKLPGIDYSTMLLKTQTKDLDVKGKGILVLSERMDLYQSNKMAGYFLNWNLSKEIFELRHYYHDLALINESFQKDPPDVIIDEQNRMKTIFSRLPLIAKQYERKGNRYERKK